MKLFWWVGLVSDATDFNGVVQGKPIGVNLCDLLNGLSIALVKNRVAVAVARHSVKFEVYNPVQSDAGVSDWCGESCHGFVPG